MRVRAIDPGRGKGLAWADFASGELVRCGMARTKIKAGIGAMALDYASQIPGTPDLCIVEQMVSVRGYSDQLGADNDLLDIQAIGGIVAGRSGAPEILYVPARNWKGQVPKDVTQRRVAVALNPAEECVFLTGTTKVPASLLDNVYDAVALGLWCHKRYR